MGTVEQQLSALEIPYVKQVIMEGGVQVEQVFFHDPDNNMIEARPRSQRGGPPC